MDHSAGLGGDISISDGTSGITSGTIACSTSRRLPTMKNAKEKHFSSINGASPGSFFLVLFLCVYQIHFGDKSDFPKKGPNGWRIDYFTSVEHRPDP